MNNWNFNEVTQEDFLDYKACKHNTTGKIYGVKDTATCQSGKEISKDDLMALSAKANRGDPKARAELKQINQAKAKQKEKEKAEKAAAEKKKKEEAEAKGKKKGKGKKGKKGKKGGGKGKGKAGGKGKGGGKAAPSAQQPTAKQRQQAKKEAVSRARDTVKRLQKMLRDIRDPKARQQIQKAIGDLMTTVAEAAKNDIGASGEGAAAVGQLQGGAAKG